MRSDPGDQPDRGRRDFLEGRFLPREARDEAARPDLAGRARLGEAVLSQGDCLAWRGVICISCESACESRAVRMDPRGRPGVEEDDCTGCGLCVPVCPTRAIRIEF
jgi:ferredoxin-type protein NapF